MQVLITMKGIAQVGSNTSFPQPKKVWKSGLSIIWLTCSEIINIYHAWHIWTQARTKKKGPLTSLMKKKNWKFTLKWEAARKHTIEPQWKIYSTKFITRVELIFWNAAFFQERD